MARRTLLQWHQDSLPPWERGMGELDELDYEDYEDHPYTIMGAKPGMRYG